MIWRNRLISSIIVLISVIILVVVTKFILGPSFNTSVLPAASKGQVENAEAYALPGDLHEQEKTSYRKIAETGKFDISEDEDGRKYWSVEAYGGLTTVLEHYVHGFSKISFRDDKSVTIKFLPEATTSDRIQAAILA